MNASDLIVENFISKHPVDAVQNLERLNIEEVILFLNDLKIEQTSNLFLHMDRHFASKCFERMDKHKAARIIEKLPSKTTIIFLRITDSQARDAIFEKLSNEISQKLKRLLNYPEQCAAAHMDTLITTLNDDLTVEEALRFMKKQIHNLPPNLFIVNREQVYKGLLPIHEIIFSPKNKKIEMLNRVLIEPIPGFSNIRDIINIEAWKNCNSLPVVDEEGKLIGALHYETLRQMEGKKTKTYFSNEAFSAGQALGDLYRIALLALMRSGAGTMEKT